MTSTGARRCRPGTSGFCLTRPDKRIHCQELALTHFVDDHPEVHAAITGTVEHQYFFRTQSRRTRIRHPHAHLGRRRAPDRDLSGVLPGRAPGDLVGPQLAADADRGGRLAASALGR